MARRPSTVSVASLASSKAPLDSLWSPDTAPVLSPLASKLSSRVISQSGSIPSNKSQDDIVDVDPDELFAKYTITEVKARQAQLRADAEAKQEDLRTMVGERYRDLLQASSSIISIATSAKRVQEVLEETMSTIQSQRVPSAQIYVLQNGKDDSHLQVLQVLSAHVKLLLDAPEHLWRLIEREKYFQAAWLFLLTRVVHRALIRDDAQDDKNWTQYGIDVLEQFPLIQRQWETVSHFRTQIIHRATLSLRVYEKSSEEICTTLLTLHILDSRPLAETLTIYLSQRTRTLNALLAKDLDSVEKRTNGFLVNSSSLDNHEHSIREASVAIKTATLVRNATKGILEAISRTLETARAIFGTSISARSLVESVLESIQSQPSHTPSSTLPTELLLDTEAVLNSLPSTIYVSLLPADIRSYRPFVDLSSTSSLLPQEVLRDKLDAWFGQSTANLRNAFNKWFASLDVVSAVWKVRSSLRRWVVHSGLLASEIDILAELLDELFRTRITDIWKVALVRSEKEFSQALSSLGGHDENDMFSPLCNLYCSAPALQAPPGGGPPSFNHNFHTYRKMLTGRLCGRAPQIQEALRTLEDVSVSLRKDLTRMSADGGNSEELVDHLIAAYSPEARALCVRVTSILKVSSEELMASSDVDMAMSKLVFYAHTTKELSLSPFVNNIGCEQAVATKFREEMNVLFQRIMSCWEEHVISKSVSYYVQKATMWQTFPHGSTYSYPSSPMMGSLYLLSSSIHNLGMSHYDSYLMTTSQRMIAKFSAAFVQNIGDGDLQILTDLSLLLHLTTKWKNAELTTLRQAVDRLRLRLTDSSKYDPDLNASECLSRTQMLISALLPHIPTACETTLHEDGDKMAGLLTYGVPVVDTLVPAVELAPPSSRFPLLLVDAR